MEDNPINRRVAMEMLNAAGMAVDCAENGLEALAAVRNRTFDAVLMDVQMPKMDGLEATRRIRRDLHLTDLPVIALTAHAMAEDKKECMAAGMNDHITKPIDRATLFAVLDRLISARAQGAASSAARPVFPGPPTQDLPVDAPGLNLAEGLERLGGDWDLYLELLGEYCHAYGDFGSQFKRIMLQEDMAAARRHAHSLKGAAGNLAATDLFLAAQSLEQACRNADMEAVERHLPDVESALAQVIRSRDRIAAAALSGCGCDPILQNPSHRPG
ncbi:MAG: response regulator [Desulfobacterales bacterium]|nr:response regulator [Desulfobacterales bacterium]